jgi:hypothetical protein
MSSSLSLSGAAIEDSALPLPLLAAAYRPHSSFGQNTTFVPDQRQAPRSAKLIESLINRLTRQVRFLIVSFTRCILERYYADAMSLAF